MSKPSNPLAFPAKTINPDEHHEGMTLRDYFAAKAMQSFLSNPNYYSCVESYESCAKAAYCMADAMLAERQKREEEKDE